MQTKFAPAAKRKIDRDSDRRGLSAQRIVGNLPVVTVRALEIFWLFGATLILSGALVAGPLSTGATYSISFGDMEGNKLSTGDGHVTIVVLSTTADHEKARTVGDRVPDFCLGNPEYRMITIIHFARRHMTIGRRVATAFIRHRVREEAKRLQARYDEKGILRDASHDIFVATDFDGTLASNLGQPEGSNEFCVFVFGRTGELLAQWHDVPSADQLASVLK